MPLSSRLVALPLSLALIASLAPAALLADEAPDSQATIASITVNPSKVVLRGPDSSWQLLIEGKRTDGSVVDLTRVAELSSLAPNTAAAFAGGGVRGIQDGPAVLRVTAFGKSVDVPVEVSESQVARSFHFENDIVPLLNRFGCNGSGCHGKAEGQNGFKLSVFGFDPPADRIALLGEGRGRRINPSLPEKSLLLLKATGEMPHGGGSRIRRGSPEYRLMRDWIVAGMPVGDADAPRVVSLKVSPNERQMRMADAQQLRAVATYSDGREVDVTPHTRFQSNNEGLASVDEYGLVTSGKTPGEAAVMAAYMGAVDVFRAQIPRVGSSESNSPAPVFNFIDPLVDAKLKKLNIEPSALCDDAEFCRRAYLDIIGMLPTSEEARAFAADTRPDRRARLVDALLERPEYADYWALKWSDLLRVDRQVLGHKGAHAYYRWIRQSLADNKPYDEFVREVVAAEGLVSDAPQGQLYKVVKEPGKAAATISQVFLGIRIECAQCHHHPFDRWSQTDYFGMTAYFSQAGFKATPQGELLAALSNPQTRHPRTSEEVFAHPLGTENPTAEVAKEQLSGDRRKLLAAWMTTPENPWFARNLVNRMWAHFMGRGLVEPVDDVRLTNPPTNPELLDALAASFAARTEAASPPDQPGGIPDAGGRPFDLKQLIRTMTASRTYQLSSKPNATNELDEQNYSRALFKRIDAEVLFDAVCQVTGVEEKFDGVPAGYRAVQVWDSHVPHYFLRIFGRPQRATACECERTSEPSVAQVLHVLNSPEIQAKLTHAGGRIAKLAASMPDNSKLVDELYYLFYARKPSSEELGAAVKFLEDQKANRSQAIEDLAWSMMNTVEFLFNH